MKILTAFFLLFTLPLIGQKSDPKEAFLEKWDNSLSYLLEILDQIPEEDFSYRPTERQMSFEEQFKHIKQNIDWLGTTYFSKEDYKMEKTDSEIGAAAIFSKKELKDDLTRSFHLLKKRVQNTSEVELSETVEFFAGPKSRWQILNLLQDHVTHHRGQLIVYLNLKGIEPPRYSGW